VIGSMPDPVAVHRYGPIAAIDHVHCPGGHSVAHR
jgi:hypothetical protein